MCVFRNGRATHAQVLIGDATLYVKGLENKIIPDVETLSPTYLPDQVTFVYDDS